MVGAVAQGLARSWRGRYLERYERAGRMESSRRHDAARHPARLRRAMDDARTRPQRLRFQYGAGLPRVTAHIAAERTAVCHHTFGLRRHPAVLDGLDGRQPELVGTI